MLHDLALTVKCRRTARGAIDIKLYAFARCLQPRPSTPLSPFPPPLHPLAWESAAKFRDADARADALLRCCGIMSGYESHTAAPVFRAEADDSRKAMTSTLAEGPKAYHAACFGQEWADAFQQKDWEARRQAVQTLGRLPQAHGHVTAVDLVCSRLGDSDALVRRAALDAGVRLLMPEPASEDATEEEASAAAEALAKVQGSEMCRSFVDKVLELLRSDEDWGVRRVAMASLGAAAPRGAESALAAVKPFLADTDDDVRAAAAAAAGRLAPLGDEAWITPLLKLLQDDDEGVRQAALLAVARTTPKGHRAALEAVGDVMDDDDAAYTAVQRQSQAPRGDNAAGLAQVKKTQPAGATASFPAAIQCGLLAKRKQLSELYGFSNINTGEWTDGLVALLVREAVSDTSDNKKWEATSDPTCRLDGPVDAIWIENMKRHWALAALDLDG
ncbi:DNAH6 [Symbiodinium natans]|uniref:DNAH6 protein n=1 Tax=Symbiodinium natans TaxID=878477 RepID=A0A812QA31_9DINO|nr:DNAH6 [Symbiodinium natans]